MGPWLNDASFFAIPFILLLFPDGRLPGRRWRPVAWALAAVVATVVVELAFTPGPIRGGGTGRVPVDNPLGVAALAWVKEVAGPAVLPYFLVIYVASLASVVMRGRRARGAERQQFKWFAFGAAVIGPAVVLEVIFPALVWAISASGAAFIGITLGIAVLRYRLFDIDVIINRTLVYGTLTATLALAYFGSIVVLQQLFRFLTGQGTNQLAIVASTLLIAALFQPLRRRIQASIDRRFYRRKYDAVRILAAFSANLRDEVEMDRLTHDLVGVVKETLQPAHVSLWLRDGGRSPRDQQLEAPRSPALR